MERKEVQEVKDSEKGERIAAFFDLDGTLMALPSLERRFFRMLRYRRAIPARNYLLWLREAVRLAPRGLSAISQSNKLYLRGVHNSSERDGRDGEVSPWYKDGHQAEEQASAPPRRNPRLPVPTFFAEAVKRVAWHAKQGHAIVLVSGTLEPLAEEAARTLETELAAGEIAVTIRVCATRLEEADGCWTGRMVSDAMFAEAKAQAVRRIAAEMKLNLAQCYAYGDNSNDWWMLAAVGRPAAVNPSRGLARIAQEHGWPILRWELKKKVITQRCPSATLRASRERRGIAESVPANCSGRTNAAEIAERAG